MDENVKKNFQNLIKYQDKDIELKKLNSLIERDPALASMNVQKKMFNDAKQAITESEQQAGNVIGLFGELRKYVDDNETVLAGLESSEAETEEELAERVKKLDSLKSKFLSAEKKARDLDDRSKNICRTRVDAIKTGNAAKQKFNDAKEKHGALVGSKSAELEALKAELAAMRPSLDEKLYAEYQKLVEENKFPPVVPASGDEKKGMFNCGGCGLSLPQQGNALLKDQGWCRCDNCRRMIVRLPK